MFFFLFVSTILWGCKKDADPIAELNKKLTNGSTRTWKLNKLFINSSQQTLSPAQLLYTKTFNKNGNWNDSDGYSGTFKIETTKTLKETTTVGGSGSITYTINLLNDTQLDIQYSFNQQTYRFVYVL